jgi:hypothetical protein
MGDMAAPDWLIVVAFAAYAVWAGLRARRLARRLLASALAALSIFALLTGLGAWLAGNLPPPWLPHRAAWIAGLLALGAALVPAWWRLALRPSPAGSR